MRSRASSVLFLAAAACQIASVFLPYYAGGAMVADDIASVVFNAPVIIG